MSQTVFANCVFTKVNGRKVSATSQPKNPQSILIPYGEFCLTPVTSCDVKDRDGERDKGWGDSGPLLLHNQLFLCSLVHCSMLLEYLL